MRNSRQARIQGIKHENDGHIWQQNAIAIADLTGLGRFDRINLAATIERDEIEIFVWF